MVRSLKLTGLLFIILLLVMAVCFKDSLLNIGHMTVLRPLRSILFPWAVFTFIPLALDLNAVIKLVVTVLTALLGAPGASSCTL